MLCVQVGEEWDAGSYAQGLLHVAQTHRQGQLPEASLRKAVLMACSLAELLVCPQIRKPAWNSRTPCCCLLTDEQGGPCALFMPHGAGPHKQMRAVQSSPGSWDDSQQHTAACLAFNGMTPS